MSKDYKFGQKNNWRRTVWNEISGRIKDTRTALVLYLAGEQDLDRKVAIEHRFLPDNLIIIERDREIVKKLRAEGKIVIGGEMEDVIFGWPMRMPEVAVLYADYCSGLEPNLASLHDVIGEKPSFMDSVVLVNLMRGRDSKTNALRDWQKIMLKPGYEKHRGCHFLVWNIWEMISILKYGEKYVYGPGGASAPAKTVRLGPFSTEDRVKFDLLLRGHNAEIYSYKSGSLIFDSIVFNGLCRGIGKAKRIISAFRKEKGPWGPEIPEMRRKISAALAIRTMRMEGRLPHSPRA